MRFLLDTCLESWGEVRFRSGRRRELGFGQQLIRDEEATTAVEYAVMLALVLSAVIGGVGAVSAETGGMWGGIVERLRDVGFIP